MSVTIHPRVVPSDRLRLWIGAFDPITPPSHLDTRRDDGDQHYIKAIPFDHFMQINWRIPDRRPSEQMSDGLKTVYREIMEAIIRVKRAQ